MTFKILRNLFNDFRSRGLTSESLSDGYVGPDLDEFKKNIGIEDNTSQRAVTYDISLNDLEKAKLINFGPIVPYENDTNSSVVFVNAEVNKKEYIWLTEKGYKYYSENRGKKKKKSIPSMLNRQEIKINDSIVLQSQIGTTAQNIENTIKIDDDQEIIGYLQKLLEQTGRNVTPHDKTELSNLVSTVKDGGDLKSIKKIFNKLFGYAKNGASQVAWNLISIIIAKQMGME